MSRGVQALPPDLTGDLDVLMIDNFDSFTWNLYQQLCLLGAKVTVIRNDAIPPNVFPKLKIKHLIISPGPGHPKTDSGISNAAINYFKGKVPVLGVCMGLECMVDSHGGEIGYAGEIMHGKVSRIRHDNRGCFKGVTQGIKSTRYHSLSASLSTVPKELAITATTQESGVIMGLRHRTYTLEAVQYHPESIMSEGGDALIKNFLALRGGTWGDNPDSGVLDPDLPPFPIEVLPPNVASSGATSKIPSILEKIYAQRLSDVSKAQKTPGTTLEDLKILLSLHISPPLISFYDRLKEGSSGRTGLLAEIKRASPSKGPIAVDTSPPAQALTYALAGASVISVLTEPKWFLGSLQDMLHVRMSVAHLPNRPAILRKDFILSRYQVIEARIHGADSILLIVSMLPEDLLRDLYRYSLELGMEPLVEVNNAREMEIALSLKAKVIGVNNRNLHSFDVDMGTTSRLSEMVKGHDVILCALSGITSPDDVKKYAAEGVGAVLIGESLMRAKDTTAFIHQLLSIPPEPQTQDPVWRRTSPLVKICGVRTKEEALAVASAGADMIGLMFVENSKRRVSFDTALSISTAIRGHRFSNPSPSTVTNEGNTPWFTTHASRLSSLGSRPLLVGVFQNASLSTVLRIVSTIQLDAVQLHGAEPTEWAQQIPVPVIRAFHIGSKGEGLGGLTRAGAHQFILLDSLKDDGSGLSGGSGKVVDWDLAESVVAAGEVVLDGGASYNVSRTDPAPGQPASGTPEVNEKTSPDDAKVDSTGNGAQDEGQEKVKATNGSAANGSTGNGHAAASPSPITSTFSKYPLPIILAGGLTPSNVSRAIAQVHPWAVDVSGGVETEDGTAKDIEKVQLFIRGVKGVADSPS